MRLNGIQHRKNSDEDGVLGTTCPIPKGRNYTYKFQLKDQIASFFYFPSTLMHKAAGGFGAIKNVSRPQIPIPFPTPAGDFSLLIGDWYKANQAAIRRWLDKGKALGMPNGVHINGQGRGNTYRPRISNVGLSTTFNFRIEGHKLKLTEGEGAHTIQDEYKLLDISVCINRTYSKRLLHSILNSFHKESTKCNVLLALCQLLAERIRPSSTCTSSLHILVNEQSKCSICNEQSK